MRRHANLLFPLRRGRPARGFTLVELLVVIGIIAVLVGILLPVLGKARAQANRAVCLSNIRQLGIGILMYCNDNDGWFPTCATPANGLSYIHYPDDWVHWQANRKLDDSAIAKYVGRTEMFMRLLRCPADTFDSRKTHPGISSGQGPYLYSYAMNTVVGLNWTPYPQGPRTKINQWRATSKKILLTEVLEKFNMAPVWSYSVSLARRHGTGRFHGDVPGDAELSRGATAGSGVSALFVDGHAEGIDQDFAFDKIHERPEAP